MDKRDRRQSSMEAVLVYLKPEFRDYEVSQFPEYKIKVRDSGATLIHEVNFKTEFLDDQENTEVRRLKEWGLVQHMKKVDPKPVWVSSTGLSS